MMILAFKNHDEPLTYLAFCAALAVSILGHLEGSANKSASPIDGAPVPNLSDLGPVPCPICGVDVAVNNIATGTGRNSRKRGLKHRIVVKHKNKS